jgi:hypothetical protein
MPTYHINKNGERKAYDHFSILVKRKTAEELKKLCNKHGLKLTHFADAAVKHYMKRWEQFATEMEKEDQ